MVERLVCIWKTSIRTDLERQNWMSLGVSNTHVEEISWTAYCKTPYKTFFYGLSFLVLFHCSVSQYFSLVLLQFPSSLYSPWPISPLLVDLSIVCCLYSVVCPVCVPCGPSPPVHYLSLTPCVPLDCSHLIYVSKICFLVYIIATFVPLFLVMSLFLLVLALCFLSCLWVSWFPVDSSVLSLWIYYFGFGH